MTDELRLSVPDPERSWRRVELVYHLDLDLPTRFRRIRTGWALRMPTPPLDRLDYTLRVTDAAGAEQTIPDPGNPRVAGGSFGSSSWLPIGAYAEPAWLAAEEPAQHLEHWGLSDTAAGELTARVWSPASSRPGDDLPMLLVHDGPELAAHAALTRFAGTLGYPLRVVLLDPGPDRDQRYSADEGYAAVLAEAVGVLRQRWPSSRKPVLAGASLGALAALHAAWRHPGTFAGLWLASGSFFSPDTDPGEQGYAHFPRIAGFTAEIAAAEALPDLGAVTMVCGTAEENLANNELLRDRLRGLGAGGDQGVGWGTARQGHTTSCWRDLFDPHLRELLATAWGC
ncbi:alpha/beta hydrolase-fold protein [Enemella evansiae]|uniref:alpha/beta hydrolase-fold protein n=1 Tax=Enemella evansiae TaxID=2016499 RepID=UPI000B97AFC6|nr:alpha/beta hydrolase-fold protein [Enemella evansiae]OYN96967.1 esterase [Enemella evansiae]OYO06191.1 esterase [Enemella evansiae]OYO11879.1 esterase [Enemella evansiae]